MDYGLWRINQLADGTWTQQCLGNYDTHGEALAAWSVCEAGIPGPMRARRWHYAGQTAGGDDQTPANSAFYRWCLRDHQVEHVVPLREG